VAKGSKTKEEPQEAGLPRLPPGRHGLSREFVTKNQQDRLAAGMIAAVAERGYHESTISHISKAAGVSRRTFYSYFSSKEACYLATYDLIAAHLLEAAREAATDKSEWSEKVAARIRSALGVFSANPDLARYVLISPLRAGGSPLARYRQGLAESAAELIDGIPGDLSQPSESAQQSMIGGILSLVASEVEAGEDESLDKMAPTLTELFLGTFLGYAEARRAAEKVA
jgi:AcrR family transcriptional regulator